jgi:hypothetical protein
MGKPDLYLAHDKIRASHIYGTEGRELAQATVRGRGRRKGETSELAIQNMPSLFPTGL